MPVTPQQLIERYRQGVAGASTRYRQGVEQTSKDWAGNWSNSQTLMTRRWNEAVSSGRMARRVQETGTQGWKQKTVSKAQNYGASAERAAEGYSQRAAQVVQAAEAASSAANAIEKTGFESSVQRVRAAMEATMRAWGRTPE